MELVAEVVDHCSGSDFRDLNSESAAPDVVLAGDVFGADSICCRTRGKRVAAWFCTQIVSRTYLLALKNKLAYFQR